MADLCLDCLKLASTALAISKVASVGYLANEQYTI